MLFRVSSGDATDGTTTNPLLCVWPFLNVSPDIVVEQRVDPPEGRIPELVGVGQEHFDEAALPVCSPHHGASGDAARPLVS